MNIFTIDTGLFKLDGGAMFGVVPKVLWSKKIEADAHNLCTWAMRLLLIEDADKLILIDTGLGDKQSDKFFSYYDLSETIDLEAALNQKGFSCAEVTDVILTHLHFDHCGGAIRRKNEQFYPTFKNAQYWSSEKHWNWATQPNAREKASFLKENILPIQESGQLLFIQRQNSLISPSDFSNIEFIFVDGHTESMMLPLIHYKGQKILYAADLLPSTAHIPLAWVMGYDTRPLHTLKEKEAILTKACDENWVICFEHDATNQACVLERTPKGIRAAQVGNLSTFIAL